MRNEILDSDMQRDTVSGDHALFGAEHCGCQTQCNSDMCNLKDISVKGLPLGNRQCRTIPETFDLDWAYQVLASVSSWIEGRQACRTWLQPAML
jgi:hypothetical protein